MMNVTKTSRVLAALQSNEKGLTEKQISARFGVAAPRGAIFNLRSKGYAIYANRKTDTAGRTKTFYRLGTPTRAVVAAGYRSLSAV